MLLFWGVPLETIVPFLETDTVKKRVISHVTHMMAFSDAAAPVKIAPKR